MTYGSNGGATNSCGVDTTYSTIQCFTEYGFGASAAEIDWSEIYQGTAGSNYFGGAWTVYTAPPAP